jgi:hypothetical protein
MELLPCKPHLNYALLHCNGHQLLASQQTLPYKAAAAVDAAASTADAAASTADAAAFEAKA